MGPCVQADHVHIYIYMQMGRVMVSSSKAQATRDDQQVLQIRSQLYLDSAMIKLFSLRSGIVWPFSIRIW